MTNWAAFPFWVERIGTKDNTVHWRASNRAQLECTYTKLTLMTEQIYTTYSFTSGSIRTAVTDLSLTLNSRVSTVEHHPLKKWTFQFPGSHGTFQWVSEVPQKLPSWLSGQEEHSHVIRATIALSLDSKAWVRVVQTPTMKAMDSGILP